MSTALERDFRRIKETVEELAGTRGAAGHPKRAVRLEELKGLSTGGSSSGGGGGGGGGGGDVPTKLSQLVNDKGFVDGDGAVEAVGESFTSAQTNAPVSFVAASTTTWSTGTSQSRQVPSGTQAGDLILAFVMHRAAITPPAGWVAVASISKTDNAGLDQWISVFKRIAVATDPGASFAWNQASSARMSTHYQVFRAEGGCDVISSVVGGQSNNEGGNDTIVATAPAGTKAGQVVIAAATSILADTSGTPQLTIQPAQWNQTTPLTSGDINNQARLGVAWRDATVGSTTSATFNSSGVGASGNAWATATLLVGSNTVSGAGVELEYDAEARTISAKNTDRGSAAVAAHVAVTDPHPQYRLRAKGLAGSNITGATTLGLSHAGRFLNCTSINNTAITVPADASAAFDIDTEMQFMRTGLGEVTFSPASGVTINRLSTRKLQIEGVYAVVTLRKTAANEWVLFGSLAPA